MRGVRGQALDVDSAEKPLKTAKSPAFLGPKTRVKRSKWDFFSGIGCRYPNIVLSRGQAILAAWGPACTNHQPGREEAVQGKGRGHRPPTTPPSELPSVRHHAGRRPWAERPQNHPPADASGELFEVVPLHPNSPLPPMAGLFSPAMNHLWTHAKASRPRQHGPRRRRNTPLSPEPPLLTRGASPPLSGWRGRRSRLKR